MYNMMEIGLYDHWERKGRDKMRYTKCEPKNLVKPTTQRKTPFKLADLASAFAVLGIGALLSFSIFIAEIVCGKCILISNRGKAS